MSICPRSKPKMALQELKDLMVKHKGFNLNSESCFVVGIRGYYKDSMGVKNANDRAIYDDAIFLVGPSAFMSFNANTDPSTYRKGKGKGSGKGMASLVPGLYRSHVLGLHRGKYTALVQRAGPVTVRRDGIEKDYEETGYFGINIHKGGFNTTSSLGCQTIYPTQWQSFISAVDDQMNEANITVMPYLLIEA